MGVAIPTTETRPVASVLAEIADIASETLELQEVFDRIARAVQQVIPFDSMGVVRIVDGQRAVLHAKAFCGEGVHADECRTGSAIPLSSWSPRWRPRAGAMQRIDDGPRELDRTYEMDAEVLDKGLGSALWGPFRHFGGGVWLCSLEPHSFTKEHEETLKPIAALLGSAVEHWRIWDTDRHRKERLERIESLLVTLSESLDVRQVFERLSVGMKPILEHDFMALTSLDMRGRTIQVTAYAGELEDDGPVPMEPVKLTDDEMTLRLDSEIIDDVQETFGDGRTERERLILKSGMRSWLRVPVTLSAEIQGGLSFFHHEPGRYRPEDTEVARRLADRMALAMSFGKLADEAQVAARERERAERLEAVVERLARELESRGRGRVTGISASWRDVLKQVSRVATSDTTVLITGESGTGKEVVSSLLHERSGRNEKPFVAINCAALPEQLLESELFGHEKGAFTGAVATKVGRLEQAAGGTLFLDEIAEMSPLVQAKFLRVLEQREFQRVGGTRTLKADVRVVAATNRDLPTGIARGTFREDLFYRLNVFQIHIPPLRERPEDILPLAESFLRELGTSMGRPAAGISRDAREWLIAYPWPGNVRELRNAIERAILLCDGGLITRDHLPNLPLVVEPPHTENGSSNVVPFPTQEWKLEAVERQLVEKALGESRGNKAKAARMLGLTRAQLYSRIEKYGII